ncbi:hypothetical protein [Helicobacter sp. MIT 11-5569]|uniref:hypothetical protein n=1 Tax=Helicobacter sp. MIT 11-5569 TaxID=1548151 RepID=UPI001375638A|nr:hypothetical protein [Helicobacter sp. MIT 11-5569]
MQEIELISNIEYKYQRKYELAKLIADKEIILAQEFDEDSAKAEIDNLVNSVK